VLGHFISCLFSFCSVSSQAMDGWMGLKLILLDKQFVVFFFFFASGHKGGERTDLASTALEECVKAASFYIV
jgi:hypothetical protein